MGRDGRLNQYSCLVICIITFAQEVVTVFALVELIPYHKIGHGKSANLNQP